ncbi:MAG: RNA polymerase Rpb4 family protein [Methanomicrobiales archaeon]|jgi:DNA-directed RNA polymerase subunit F|nr:RNA polymerase Rpb4 family protein [Methanomicrobiales archaeon]
MNVKGIVAEERITLAEVKETLLAVEASRVKSGSELPYELRRSIEHANQLAKTSPDNARALVELLLKLEKIKPDIAYRIVNLMPRTRDELRSIYAKERFTLSGEELDEIIELVITHY